MDHIEKNEKNICCPLCCETDRSPEYGPKIHRFRNSRGDAEIASYKVFPGIELNMYAVHMDSFFFGAEEEGNFMEIHHCREGRMEQGLEDVNVRPRELARWLCADKNCFIIRSQAYIEHIFSELYSVPEECKKGYFKIKVLELLFVLGSVSPEKNSAPALSLSKLQADLAKEAAAWLAENLDRQVSVSELSGRFHVSQTHLQNAFKGVYGVPVSSYIRILKMQSAALRLIRTDAAILEIASEFGYSNAGKFASAFQKIMGIRILPLRYRDGRALIYAYRPSKLSQDLQQADACSLLEKRGYTFGAPERCIIQLMQRLADGGEFPHEIGLFLGYPPEDVSGFIENRAKGYKCVGEWKVYGDADKAKETFAEYRKCTEACLAQFVHTVSFAYPGVFRPVIRFIYILLLENISRKRY